MPASTCRRCIRPARRRKADNWTWTTFLKAAETCHKAGFPFGIGLGQTSDSVDSVGAFFQSYGAELVDAKGDITVKSDAVRQALEYCKRLVKFLPPDAPAWDDASNNKWLIVRQGRADHESAERLGGGQARRAARSPSRCWTHGFPTGPKGRFAPFLPYFWGIWNFGKNKSAAKSLLVHMSQPGAVEKLVAASGGYDMPSFANLHDVQDLGRGRAAEGHALPLSQPARPPDPVDRRGARPRRRSPSRSTPRRSRPR